jgi:uncharacterized membrane protein YqjE
MTDTDNGAPGLGTLSSRIAKTACGLFENRSELLLLELQEERARLIETLIWGIGLLFMAMMALVVLTGAVILLFPQEYRIYAAGAFALLYLIGAVVALMTLKRLLSRAFFPSTMSEIRKDKELMDTLE